MAGNKRKSYPESLNSTDSLARNRHRPGGGRLAMRAHATNTTRLASMSHINLSDRDDDDSLFIPLSPRLQAAVDELKREKTDGSPSATFQFEDSGADVEGDGMSGQHITIEDDDTLDTPLGDATADISHATPRHGREGASSTEAPPFVRGDSILSKSEAGTGGSSSASTKTQRRWARRSAFKSLPSKPAASPTLLSSAVSSPTNRSFNNRAELSSTSMPRKPSMSPLSSSPRVSSPPTKNVDDSAELASTSLGPPSSSGEMQANAPAHSNAKDILCMLDSIPSTKEANQPTLATPATPKFDVMAGVPDFLSSGKDRQQDSSGSVRSATSDVRSELERRRQKALKDRAKFQRAYDREDHQQSADLLAIEEAQVSLSAFLSHGNELMLQSELRLC